MIYQHEIKIDTSFYTEYCSIYYNDFSVYITFPPSCNDISSQMILL